MRAEARALVAVVHILSLTGLKVLSDIKLPRLRHNHVLFTAPSKPLTYVIGNDCLGTANRRQSTLEQIDAAVRQQLFSLLVLRHLVAVAGLMVEAQIGRTLVLSRDALEALATVSVPLKLVQAVSYLSEALWLRRLLSLASASLSLLHQRIFVVKLELLRALRLCFSILLLVVSCR